MAHQHHRMTWLDDFWVTGHSPFEWYRKIKTKTKLAPDTSQTLVRYMQVAAGFASQKKTMVTFGHALAIWQVNKKLILHPTCQ